MREVVLRPYAPEWPEVFRDVREELLVAFAPVAVSVEHIGSTSVPGLAAKPVIDVLLGACSLSDVESRIGVLGELGYVYVPKHERELPTRRYFKRSSPTSLRVHLHAVEIGSRIWQEQLAFRDALRADPDLLARYQDLKRRLAEEFASDKAAYTAAKGPFVRSVLAALLEGADAAGDRVDRVADRGPRTS